MNDMVRVSRDRRYIVFEDNIFAEAMDPETCYQGNAELAKLVA